MLLTPLTRRGKLPLGISVAVALFALAIIRSVRNKKKQQQQALGYKQVPVGPGRWPIFGHLFSLGKTPLFTFKDWHKQLGPLVQVDFGARSLILVGDAAAVQTIFVSEGESTSSRKTGTYTYEIYGRGGKGLIASPMGKEWKHARMMALTVLAPKIVHQFEAAVRDEMRAAARKLGDISQQDDGVNPIDVFQLASMNIMMSTCFGSERMDSIEDPKFKEILYFIDTHIKNAGQLGDLTAIFPFLRWIEPLARQNQKMEKFIHEYRDEPIKELMRSALASDKPSLTKTMDEHKDQLSMDEVDKIVFLSDMLVAGSDTTATTVTWMLAILVRYPDVQAKIQAEIDAFKQTHDGRLPTFEDRETLPYTIAVQKECMRFRTTTSFGVPRQTTKDVVWNGYFIPKGSTLAGNMYAIHRDPTRYPEPDTFIPERFMDNTKGMMAAANGRFENRDHFNFGWGRRICPGIHLAETEIFDAFVAVFGQYDVHPVLDAQGKPIYPIINTGKPGGVVVPPDPFKIRVSPREAPAH